MIQSIIDNLAAIIIAFTGFLALFLKQRDDTKKLEKGILVTRQRVNETKHAVTNSHPEHLRDDMDRKHSAVMAKLNDLQTRMSDIEQHKHSEHTGIWEAITDLRRRK